MPLVDSYQQTTFVDLATNPPTQPVVILSRPVTSPAAAELLLTATLQVGEKGLSGNDSQVRCWLEVRPPGGSYSEWSLKFAADLEGNNQNDERQSLALTTGGQIPSGTSHYRLMCDTASFGGAAYVNAAAVTSQVVP